RRHTRFSRDWSSDVCSSDLLKALAAADNNVPFYVALPSTTIDWDISDGLRDIPIEERDAREVSHILGRHGTELLEVVTVGEHTRSEERRVGKGCRSRRSL